MLALFVAGAVALISFVIYVVAEWAEVLPRGRAGDRVKGVLGLILLVAVLTTPQSFGAALDRYSRWKANELKEQITDLLPVPTPPTSDRISVP